ncbi:MAG: peptidylprolyl isomerase [Bacilli bacterium]|nr:peptidylprolyl isomerase [Bacilli bacterium]
MKKSKLSITLVTSFIAAMALTACNEVTTKDGAIVTFTPYGSSEEITLITDNMYSKYRGTSNGISKFYDKILEVLIRYQFKEKNFEGEMGYSEIDNWANNQVQEQKDKAKDNAKSNKTSYDDEWDAILEAQGVEDEDELKEKFIYQKEKEVMTNWYAGDKDKAEELKSEFIGVDDNGDIVQEKLGKNVAGAMPYHVRHILVKVDEASDAQAKFYKGTITEAQAKLLSDTVTTLASGKYTFSQIASMYSEDGSASSGGDVGIMTNGATSGSLGMVNEFQLGIYAYDNLYDADHAGNAKAEKIQEKLGINDTVKNSLPNTFAEVPYDAFVKIGEYAKVTADKFGNKLANGSATVYPRNVLWNKYLNLHNVFLIKNVERAASKFGAADAADEFTDLASATVDANAPATDRFNADGYLVDDHGNVIIGVRSQYGIHFMVVEKSIYDFNGPNGRSKLSEYYSTKLPSDDGYNPDSYVGYIVSQSSEDYKKRADELKDKINSFDPTYDYRLYQYLNTQVAVTFSGKAEHLGEEIDAYIASIQKNNLYKQADGLEKVWRTYNELLDVQEDNRNAQFDIVNSIGAVQANVTRLVSEAVADDFMKIYNGLGDATTYAKFAEGGSYYYYA